MTLNITAIYPPIVAQVSDRRFTNPETGQVVDDEANKAVIFACTDAVLSITFAGIGRAGTERVDWWLAHSLQEAGMPELAAENAIDHIAEASTKWFRTFPRKWPKHHVFSVAGWKVVDRVSVPAAWLVSNCPGGIHCADDAHDEFHIEPLRLPKHGMFFVVTGYLPGFTRAERRRLQAGLRRAAGTKTVDSLIGALELSLVGAIKDAASNATSKDVIGKNCMALSLAASRQARATHYPEAGSPHSYGPIAVWNAGGTNACAGDIQVLPGSGYRIIFGSPDDGFALSVGRPGERSKISPENVLKLAWKMNLSLPKFGPEPEVGAEAALISIAM